jgi:hypothetical protein
MFVGKDQYMVFKHYEEVAEFLPLTGLTDTLVLVDARVAP